MLVITAQFKCDNYILIIIKLECVYTKEQYNLP